MFFNRSQGIFFVFYVRKRKQNFEREKSWIAISGGTLNITAKGDGIQAETDCYIDGGTLNVTTTGEIAVNTSDDQPFGGGGFGGGFDNGQSPFDRQTPPQGGNRPDGAAPMEKPDDATGSQPAETAPAVTTTTITTNTETTTDTNTTAAEDANSKGIKAGNTFKILNIIKIPFPAVEYKSDGQWAWHWFYF